MIRSGQRRRGAGPSPGLLEDCADMPVHLFASLPLRLRAWELRENLTTADALFVSLAESVGRAAGHQRTAPSQTPCHRSVSVQP